MEARWNSGNLATSRCGARVNDGRHKHLAWNACDGELCSNSLRCQYQVAAIQVAVVSDSYAESMPGPANLITWHLL